MILLENVKKIYKAKSGDVTAVDNANLKIDKGEIFGVIGYSGAGKSSLIRLFNQLEKPTSGQITIANRVISAITGSELRKARQEIGMIFQHFNLLWSRTVRENIEFPLEIAGVDKAKRRKRVDEPNSSCWIRRKRRRVSISAERRAKATRWDCKSIS